MQKENNARFVSFEGGEGSGKTTQSSLLHEHLVKKSIKAILTREPGGSDLGEELRILLKKQHNPKAELLLLLASRHDHVQNLILPGLASGNWVICDRFIDSTMCYQGLLKELGIDYIKNLHAQIIGEVWPNFTFLMDLPTKYIKDRINTRENLTHYDTMPVEQHEKVRNGFLEIAKSFPNRIVVLDATKDPKIIHEEIVKLLGVL